MPAVPTPDEKAGDSSLLVIVPARGRRAQLERLLASFTETASDGTDIAVITDADDQDTYDGIDWGRAMPAVLDPRGFLAEKLNQAAMAMADAYRVLAWCADDHVFKTPQWDTLMLDALEDLGGTGWVYPDTKRRNDVPEIWMCSSDVVKALGWFANPKLDHFLLDNSVAELGKRAGLIRWCPQAVVEHLHYSVCGDTEHDEVYRFAEEKFGQSDLKAFNEWRANHLANEVALLRRQFSPDVAWALSRVLSPPPSAGSLSRTALQSPSRSSCHPCGRARRPRWQRRSCRCRRSPGGCPAAPR
jgi:hypothetical protein